MAVFYPNSLYSSFSNQLQPLSPFDEINRIGRAMVRPASRDEFIWKQQKEAEEKAKKEAGERTKHNEIMLAWAALTPDQRHSAVCRLLEAEKIMIGANGVVALKK